MRKGGVKREGGKVHTDFGATSRHPNNLYCANHKAPN